MHFILDYKIAKCSNYRFIIKSLYNKKSKIKKQIQI